MERQTAAKKQRFFRAICALLAAGLLLAALMLGVSEFMKASVEECILPFDGALSLDADCILVLGAGLRGNGTPSTILADRLDCATALYLSGASDRLLMSGDHSRRDYNEVAAMRDYVLPQGVDCEHVFLDHAGFSTYESIYRARDVFAAKRIIIVTQSYHLYRALYSAHALGVDAIGVASDYRSYGKQTWYDVREIPARTKDFFKALFDVPSTYVGDPISLDQSGDVTG